MKPVIKWAGGKSQLLPVLCQCMPPKNNINRYYEPFFGGGALFFEICPNKATINDNNLKLMNVYKVVRDNPKELMDLLDDHEAKHNESYYIEIRNRYNENILNGRYSILDAADFIYLNKMCYNGLYRVNLTGLFNVPSGRKKTCVLYDSSNILEVSKALKNVTIQSTDFYKACCHARQGDFVFFDSPYFDTFDNYLKEGFSKADHIRLSDLYKKLTEKKVYCMLTNSDTDFIKDLYRDFNIAEVEVHRMINCDGKNRSGKEIIITNY